MPPQEKMPETGSGEPECNPGLEMQCSGGYTNRAFISDSVMNEKKAQKENEQNADEETKFEFDDLLPQIGEFGIYQKILFLMMIPFAFFVAWVYFTQIFITIIPEQHWCWVPELQNLTAEER